MSFERIMSVQMVLQIPASSIRYRKEFHSAYKDVNETMEHWYSRLERLSEACEYGEYGEAFLLNQFICGLDGMIFERLCAEEGDLSLTNIIDFTHTYELGKEQLDVVSVNKGNTVFLCDNRIYLFRSQSWYK